MQRDARRSRWSVSKTIRVLDLSRAGSLSLTTLTRRQLVAGVALSAVTLAVGAVLIHSGYNEAFYVEDPAVRAIFNIVTDLGSETFYVVFFTALYFSIDKEFSKNLIVAFLVSNHINATIKVLCRDPRPPTNIVNGRPIETSYGFPSNHSQLSTVFWGYTFIYAKGKPMATLVQTACVALMFLVPISRVVIGVHDLQDIIGGTVIGMLFLVAYLSALPRLEEFRRLPTLRRIPVGMIAVLVLWAGSVLAFPEAAEDFGISGGLLMACALTFPIEERHVNYRPEGLSPIKRLFAGVFGMASTFVVYFALGATIGQIQTLGYVWRFFRYFAIGIFIVLIVPAVLKKLLGPKRPSSKSR